MVCRSANFEVVSITAPLFERGLTRYAAHHDKSWSLTDCLSMDVMLDNACIDVATPDPHFAQAGFTVLMVQVKSYARTLP
jgi:predicted nucleic acid-binding protein